MHVQLMPFIRTCMYGENLEEKWHKDAASLLGWKDRMEAF
jgi:hypothetical protein